MTQHDRLRNGQGSGESTAGQGCDTRGCTGRVAYGWVGAMCSWYPLGAKGARAKRARELNLANSISQMILITAAFYLRRFSTTIYNVLFVTGMFDLFTGARPIRQARFFFGYDLRERRSQHSPLPQSPLNPASLDCPYPCVCHQIASQMSRNTTIAVHAYFFHLLGAP